MFGRKPRSDPQARNPRSDVALRVSLDSMSADDHVPRIAIAENGQILYASETFYALSHLDKTQSAKIDVRSILKFPGKVQTMRDIGAGLHKVKINGHKESFNFHFDWLSTPGGARYLVGSQAQEGTAKAPAPNKDTVISDIEELAHFLNMAHEAMAVMDEDGNILRANKTFHSLLGTTEGDLAAGTLAFIDLFSAADKPYIRNTIQNFAIEEHFKTNARAKNKGVIDFEAQAQTKSGKLRAMEWRQWQKGGLIYALGRDVTALKNQKDALERREKQLEQAESIGRMGHWHWTIGQDTVNWSDEIYRIFGFERGEFNPTIESMAALINRRDIARVNQAFERAIIEQNDYDMEFSIKRPDGDTRYIRCEGRCALDAHGDVVALYGIMQDMTERVLYEQELKAAKDSAERAYAAKSQFLANMSHELRTPLNAVIGFSEMIQQQLLGPIGTEKYLEYIDGIRQSGEHLLDLISDILDMSKIEAGKYELVLEEFNVAKTMKMAAHMMESRALDAGVKLGTEGIQNDALKIIGDRRAFMQIMLNLMSNAVKFSRQGGQVSVECHERADYLAVKVIDTGIGIPANKLAQVTRPFEQVSSSYAREHEGSGLGLAITKELAEMHGGNLHIESIVGEGTIVTVRLPYDASKTMRT